MGVPTTKRRKKLRILNLLFTAGLVLIILGVALAIGAKVNNDFSVSSLVSESSTVVNETVAANNATPASLSMSGASINKLVTGCSYVINNSDDMTTFSSGNYTCGSDGTFTWLKVDVEGAISVNVTYSQTWETWSGEYNTSHSGEEGLGNLSSWSTSIATVVAAVVIIGLLMAGFSGFMMFGRGGV